MSTTIKIQGFRLSFIWLERQPASFENPVTDSAQALEAFLKGPDPAGNVLLGPLLGNNATYEQIYKAVYTGSYSPGKSPEDTPGGLALPWETTSRHHFWVYYPCNHEAQDVTARLAWNRFVPFYKKLKVTGLPKWFSLQTFYYPHGLALVATAYCTGDWTLYQAVERAQQIRADERFEITLPGKQPARYVKICTEGSRTCHLFPFRLRLLILSFRGTLEALQGIIYAGSECFRATCFKDPTPPAWWKDEVSAILNATGGRIDGRAGDVRFHLKAKWKWEKSMQAELVSFGIDLLDLEDEVPGAAKGFSPEADGLAFGGWTFWLTPFYLEIG